MYTATDYSVRTHPGTQSLYRYLSRTIRKYVKNVLSVELVATDNLYGILSSTTLYGLCVLSNTYVYWVTILSSLISGKLQFLDPRCTSKALTT